MSLTRDIRVGDQIWLDGSVHVVGEIGRDKSVITWESGVRVISTRELVMNAVSLRADDAPLPLPDPAPERLTALTPAQQSELDRRVGIVNHVLSQIEATGISKGQCCASTAERLNLSGRTIRRWVDAYNSSGPVGLLDTRVREGRPRSVDPRWDSACLAVLNAHVSASTPSKNVVIDHVRRHLEDEFGEGVVSLPSRAVAYRRLDELAKGRHAFGSSKNRRSVANRPKGPYGRLRPTRPGEYVVLDTTPLDVFAMEPLTLRWVPVELTIAQDLYTRCILGLRLAPVSTSSEVVANVLYQCVVPQSAPNADDGAWPFHGVPQNVELRSSDVISCSDQRPPDKPHCLPETIIVDHGKPYVSHHITSSCARLGISIQPAIPGKPTDKPTAERFFRTLRLGLLQHLPAYKGPDVYNRGEKVEEHAFHYIGELERIIRDWVGTVYHRSKHDGLCLPEVPGAAFSPIEMYEIGLARVGGLTVPTSPDLAYEFLDVRWRTIQHYGVEVHGRRYDGPALNHYRVTQSPYGGANAGKWPIYIDSSDVRKVHFRDPVTKAWAALDWEHAASLDQPFSAAAAEYTKKVSLREGRHVDPLSAVQTLLQQWTRDEVQTRRDKMLAKRLASARTCEGSAPADSSSADAVSLPGVIDLLAHRERRDPGWSAESDLDVFEHFDGNELAQGGYEVFDE